MGCFNVFWGPGLPRSCCWVWVKPRVLQGGQSSQSPGAGLCGHSCGSPSGHGHEPCSCKPDLVPWAASPHCLGGITHPEPTLCHGLQGSVLTCPVARPLLGTCAPVPASRGSEVQGVPCHPCMALSRGKRVFLVSLRVWKGSAIAGRWSRQ